MKRIMAVLTALALLCGAFALPAAAIDSSAFAAEVLRLVNEERAKAGLAALQGGPASLDAAANLRAQEISVSFSHSRPDGSSCFTVLNGISYAACGENIASGQATPAQVMAGWMNSPGHRANILGSYNRLGVGVCEQNGRLHWAQLFILERASTNAVTTTTRAAATTKATTTARVTATTRAATTTRTTTTTRTGTAAGAANTANPPGETAPALPAWLQWVLRVLFFGWIWM